MSTMRRNRSSDSREASTLHIVIVINILYKDSRLGLFMGQVRVSVSRPSIHANSSRLKIWWGQMDVE